MQIVNIKLFLITKPTKYLNNILLNIRGRKKFLKQVSFETNNFYPIKKLKGFGSGDCGGRDMSANKRSIATYSTEAYMNFSYR